MLTIFIFRDTILSDSRTDYTKSVQLRQYSDDKPPEVLTVHLEKQDTRPHMKS